MRFFTSRKANVETKYMRSFGRWCMRSMGSIQWVSAIKMQIYNWLEVSEGRSLIAHGGILFVRCLSLDGLNLSLAQSHCRYPPTPPCSTMVIGNYRLRFVCVSLWENEREGEVSETKEVLSIGIFLAKHWYWDLISYCGVARCWVVLGIVFGKKRKCKNSKENKRKWDFFLINYIFFN